MTGVSAVATRRPSGSIYRLGRTASLWSWPDWAYAGEDGTFGNRYDDPHGRFRVLYASSDRLGAFLETLARFRPDPHVLAAAIDEDGEYPTAPAGHVPAAWLGSACKLAVSELEGQRGMIPRVAGAEAVDSALRCGAR